MYIQGLARIIGFVIFICTNYFATAYETTIWPVLGWLFMPITTLTYMWAMNENGHHVTGGWIIMMIIAVCLDFSLSAGADHEMRA